MKIRVLIVEDDPIQNEGMEMDLVQLSQEKRRHYGIEEFIIDKALSEQDAMTLLNKALEVSQPYDLLLLDLSLPVSTTIIKESPEHGLNVLKHAMTSGAAKAVIIVSVYDKYHWVVKAFRAGAVDFIAKPFTGDVLQAQVLSYFEKEGQRIIRQRAQALSPYAEQDLAYRLGRCFSRFVQSVVNEMEGLEEHFKQRWGLDPERDKSDPQMRHLIFLDEAVRDAKREWSNTLSAVGMEASEQAVPVVCNIEDVLNEVRDYAYPSLALKNVNFIGNLTEKTPVRVFLDDARQVTSEIILGALYRIDDHDDKSKEIRVSVVTKGRKAQIQFEDNLRPIRKDAAKSINEGAGAPVQPQFDRAWGLSIAQHIARRGGGSIEVQPNANGNVIMYYLPRADHA